MAVDKRLTIILSTVIPVVFVIGLIMVLWRYGRRRNSLFNRGITPIADEEIESWKNDRNDEEKEPIPEAPDRVNGHEKSHRHHQQNSSVSSCNKPPSVIVYQNNYNSRISGEQSPRSNGHPKHSMELPQTPVLARAPNARPGLTDDTVQGDDAFIPQLKRQPSRLSKNQSGQHQRHKSAYSAIGAPGGRDRWYGHPTQDYHTRQSADNIPRRGSTARGHERIYSATENPPRMSLDEAVSPGGLSPRPLLHKSEIGRAIG